MFLEIWFRPLRWSDDMCDLVGQASLRPQTKNTNESIIVFCHPRQTPWASVFFSISLSTLGCHDVNRKRVFSENRPSYRIVIDGIHFGCFCCCEYRVMDSNPNKRHHYRSNSPHSTMEMWIVGIVWQTVTASVHIWNDVHIYVNTCTMSAFARFRSVLWATKEW